MESEYFNIKPSCNQLIMSQLGPGHHVKAFYQYDDKSFVDLTVLNDMFMAKVYVYSPLLRGQNCLMLDICTPMPSNIYGNSKLEELFVTHQQFNIDQWRTLFHSAFLLGYEWTMGNLPQVLIFQHENCVTYYFKCDYKCTLRRVSHYTAFKIESQLLINVPQYFCHHKQHAVRCGKNSLIFCCLCTAVRIPLKVLFQEVTPGPCLIADATKLFLSSNLLATDPWYVYYLLFLGISPMIEGRTRQVCASGIFNETQTIVCGNGSTSDLASSSNQNVTADLFKKPTAIPQRRTSSSLTSSALGNSNNTHMAGTSLPSINSATGLRPFYPQVLPSPGSIQGGMLTCGPYRSSIHDRLQPIAIRDQPSNLMPPGCYIEPQLELAQQSPLLRDDPSIISLGKFGQPSGEVFKTTPSDIILLR